MAGTASNADSQPPALNVTHPIPPHPQSIHRPLYRGSLSLPDSELVLEGIVFIAHLPPISSTALLESPIALALESMRGLPSLRFVSTVNLSDVHHECAGDIRMYIHPRSTLTRSFFENVLCTERVNASDHTVMAIRIGLGDGHGPDNTDLLVFGSLLPSQSMLQMTVARVSHRPSAPHTRAPRPDDPTPRRPPTLSLSTRNVGNKRRRSDTGDVVGEEHGGKRGKIDQTVTLKKLMAQEIMFKLPRTNSGEGAIAKGKHRADEQALLFKDPGASGRLSHDEDVFNISSGSVTSKPPVPCDLEMSNKTMLKKLAVKALAARGMPKEHPDFRELFGWITRGVAFALRHKMKSVKLDNDDTRRLVDTHVLMYFDGFGGPSGKG